MSSTGSDEEDIQQRDATDEQKKTVGSGKKKELKS
jgi:hypothetical protein